MNCLSCRSKSCRTGVSCGGEKFQREEVLAKYHGKSEAAVVETAAKLVDGGRAGTLSRIEELIEFVKTSDYKKVGLAYCYGMEKLAEDVRHLFTESDIRCIGISCTCGAMGQNEINSESDLPGVSCNPISQAKQMEAEGVDLAVVIGLCMGHDILFTREFSEDQTTLLVKDRPNNHAPLEGITKLLSS